MPKTHKRHKSISFNKGDLVEYIGVDRNNRGIGIVLEEVAPYYYSSEYSFSDEQDFIVEEKQSTQYTHIRVHWQNTLSEETLHKSRVRRIPEVAKANFNVKNKKTIKE